jgi:hypothetical protein
VIVNVGWVAALGAGWAAADFVPDLEFWQIYFLTTPHRWLTLLLVATDPDRRADWRGWFLPIGVVAALAVTGVWLTTGQFLCLAVVDYLWNAWHFGAQHHGILRMYARRVGGGRPLLEKWVIRTLVVYTAIRLASQGWLLERPEFRFPIDLIDWGVVASAAWLLATELSDHPARRLGKVAYLTSVTLLYCLLILAIRRDLRAVVVPLVVGSAAFHATEYLAIVSYYAWRRKDFGTRSLFQTMARRWSAVLLVFVILLGIFSVSATSRAQNVWLGLNLWAAFLHYAYDGMIWKLRKPQTAKVLAVEIAAPSPQRVTSP